MSTRRKLAVVWGVIGLLIALLLVPMWRPLHVAWQCYWLHENGEREQARVVKKLDESATFALAIEQGPHGGQACTADTSLALYEATPEGALLEVVVVDWKPGTCELSSTIDASGRLLWSFVGVLAAAVLGLLALGAFVHRSFTRAAHPRRRMPVAARDVRCPVCGKAMDEGYLPLLAGLHWRRPGEPVGLPHALRGLPGTVGWRERPRLHAFRCAPCEIVTLQYGDPTRR